MKMLKPPLIRAAAVVYAGYKWLENNTDEVERWGEKAVKHARGKKYEVAVVPPAQALIKAAKWIEENQREKQAGEARRQIAEA